MKLTITLDMDNAAFEDAPWHEVAGILQDYAHRTRVVGEVRGEPLLDRNGNTVGRAEISEEPADGMCPDCGKSVDSNDGLHGRLC